MTRILPCALALTTSGCFAASRDEPLAASGTDTFDNDSIGSDSFQDDDPPIGSDSFQDDDPPIGCRADGCSAGDGDNATGAPVGASCDNTDQCVAGAVCGASFEEGNAGPLLCRSECIEVDDDAAWCSDDSACCSGVCSPRGLCLEAEESDGDDSTSEGTG